MMIARFRPLLMFACCALLLTGCSRTEFVYRNADWLITRWADAQLDLSAAQQRAWEPQLEAALDRHRSEELPRLAAWLQAAEQAARQRLGTDELACLADWAEALYERHARLAVTLALPLLEELGPQQIAHLRGRWQERNAEYRAEYLSGSPRQQEAARAERYRERVERWTGRLNPAQREMVAGSSRALPNLAALWLAYREDRQAGLLALLDAGAPPQDLRAYLVGWWVDLAGRSPELAAASKHARDETLALLARLDNSLTPAQRRTLGERFGRLGRELQGLSGGPMLAAEGLGPACAARSG
jgi:hypothetical protein